MSSLKEYVLSQKNVNTVFTVLQKECNRRYGVTLEPTKYMIDIYNTINNHIIEDPRVETIKVINKKNVDLFNSRILDKLLLTIGKTIETQGGQQPQDLQQPMNTQFTGDPNNVKNLMYQQINSRNSAGMKINVQSPVQPTQSGQLTDSTQHVGQSIDPTTMTTTTIPSFSELPNYTVNPLKSRFITVDFRADLLHIDDNVYTLSFPNVDIHSLELYSCQLQSSQYIKSQPSMLIGIQNFDGKYVCGNDEKFFCKLIPFNIIDNIYLFKPEPHVYEITSTQRINDNNIVVSFNTYDGQPFSLTKIDVDKVRNVLVNENKGKQTQSSRHAKITTTHPHGLERNDTVTIIYLQGDEFRSLNFDVHRVIDDYAFLIDEELEHTKNVTVHKKSLKCSMTFRYM
jgi:hypothetical protein